MARGRPSGRPSGVGRLALVPAAAALIIGACGGGSGEAPPPPEAPAAAPEAPAAAIEAQDAAADAEPVDGEQAEPAGDTGDVAGATDEAPARGSAESAPTDGDGAAEPAGPAGLDPETEARLLSLLGELEGLARDWDPAGRASLAVVVTDGSLYGFNEQRRHISASAVKPVWTAAAIDLAGLAAVEPLAEAALVQSDNFAAGAIIDLVGIDAVNAWSSDVAGMTSTHLAAWHFGTDRVAQSVTEGGTRANFTTVGDLARFYAGLRRGELLDDGGTALEAWLRRTDRGAYTAGAVTDVLLARLPEDVAAAASHKAGWLPPYCCSAEVRLVIDAGVIPLPDGSWFAVAAVSDRGDYYNLSVRWVSLAACRTYALLADDPDHDCDRPGDGVPRPELWQPPEPEVTDPESEVADADSEAIDAESEPTDPEAESPEQTQHTGDATEADDADTMLPETPQEAAEPAPQDAEGPTGPEEPPSDAVDAGPPAEAGTGALPAAAEDPPPGADEGDPPGGESSG
ncbi:MAG: serine hydrolase [bacterium]|nr:serine hydrolase [bacterium]